MPDTHKRILKDGYIQQLDKEEKSYRVQLRFGMLLSVSLLSAAGVCVRVQLFRRSGVQIHPDPSIVPRNSPFIV